MFREGWVCKVINTYCVLQASLSDWPGVSSSFDLGCPSEAADAFTLLPSGSSVSTQPWQVMCHEAQLRNPKNPFWPPRSYCFSNETAVLTAWVLTSVLGRWEKKVLITSWNHSLPPPWDKSQRKKICALGLSQLEGDLSPASELRTASSESLPALLPVHVSINNKYWP